MALVRWQSWTPMEAGRKVFPAWKLTRSFQSHPTEPGVVVMKVVAERPWRGKDGKVKVWRIAGEWGLHRSHMEKADVALVFQGVIEKLREAIGKGPA